MRWHRKPEPKSAVRFAVVPSDPWLWLEVLAPLRDAPAGLVLERVTVYPFHVSSSRRVALALAKREAAQWPSYVARGGTFRLVATRAYRRTDVGFNPDDLEGMPDA